MSHPQNPRIPESHDDEDGMEMEGASWTWGERLVVACIIACVIGLTFMLITIAVGNSCG